MWFRIVLCICISAAFQQLNDRLLIPFFDGCKQGNVPLILFDLLLHLPDGTHHKGGNYQANHECAQFRLSCVHSRSNPLAVSASQTVAGEAQQEDRDLTSDIHQVPCSDRTDAGNNSHCDRQEEPSIGKGREMACK